MPKTLIEADLTDEFETSITVPDGDDDMDDAANVVEAIAQRAANRTRYLYNRTAKLAAANLFTGQNTFNDPVFINDTLRLGPQAADVGPLHFSRTSGHDYQEIITARSGTDSNDQVRLYSGINGETQGAFYIVINAQYTVGTPSTWSLVNTTKPATALIVRNGNVRVVSKPAGVVPATWTSWQQNDVSNIAAFDSEMLAEVFRAARVLTTGPVFNAYEGVGFRYTTPIQRISPIPFNAIYGNVGSNGSHVRRREFTYNASTNDDGFISIPVPPFNSFGRVRVRFIQWNNDGAPDRFLLQKRVQDGPWTDALDDGPATNWESTAAVSASNNELSAVVIDLHPGPETMVLDGEEYRYLWRRWSNSTEARENRIVGASVSWTDYGPTNRIG